MIGLLMRGGLYIVFIGAVAAGWINKRLKRSKKMAPPAAEPVITTQRDLPGLLDALKHSDWHTREQAARELGALHDTAAINGLLGALRDSDRDVRAAAADGLVALGRLSIPGLLDTLRGGDMNARESSAQALARLADPVAVPGLIDALKKDESAWVRAQAANALGIIRERTSVPAMIAALQDEDSTVREAVSLALREIGTKEALNAVEKMASAK